MSDGSFNKLVAYSRNPSVVHVYDKDLDGFIVWVLTTMGWKKKGDIYDLNKI